MVKYNESARYVNKFELKSSKIDLAAANLSVEKFSLHSSLFTNETDVSRNFSCSLRNVSLEIGGPALSINENLRS